ncbi:hypothetical protein [Spiroplasma endosymbiont of Dilophus febrilis]|uniref:hypothetical protein n=1 Tax=Spiroplasma endosymbiont of Dilophus febrilis TaxID=3066292 RepID=UPI00313E030D
MENSLTNKIPVEVERAINENINVIFNGLMLSVTDEKYLNLWYRYWGLLLIILSFIVMLPVIFLSFIFQWAMVIPVFLIIITIICILTGITILFLRNKAWTKLISAFNNLETLSSFYSYYTNIAYPEVVISEVKAGLTNLPVKHQSFYNDFFYKNTFVGKYKDFPFQFGTIIYEHLTTSSDNKGNSHLRRTYYRKLYLIAKTKATNLITTVNREDLKIIRSLRKNKDCFESAEFGSLFKLQDDDPINLRKLFTPIVMEKLTTVALDNNKKIPQILINNDEFSFIWDLGPVASPNSELLCSFHKVHSLNQIRNVILDNVYYDIEMVIKYLCWLEAFNVNNEKG